MEQRDTLGVNMRGYGHISDHLAFDNENGVGYSDELIEEIEKTAIEAAHDMAVEETHADPAAPPAKPGVPPRATIYALSSRRHPRKSTDAS
jgi:hypothetical protein